MTMGQQFLNKGWCLFPDDPVLRRWVDHALPAAQAAIADPDNAEWLRCGGTWHVGVNVLPNDTDGSVGGGPVVAGDAVAYIRDELDVPAFEWDRAQVSVCYPGYPRRMETELDNAFSFRLNRDAAHVDGLRREGEHGRRFLREHHGFILGIPLTHANAHASPFVIWEGSHEIIRQGFKALFDGMAPETWGDVDVTESYRAMRRQVFETCKRAEIAASPGQAYVVHRLALHGVAPWQDHATADEDGRMIAYFRPDFGNVKNWLFSP